MKGYGDTKIVDLPFFLIQEAAYSALQRVFYFLIFLFFYFFIFLFFIYLFFIFIVFSNDEVQLTEMGSFHRKLFHWFAKLHLHQPVLKHLKVVLVTGGGG